ncbi:MAG: DUF3828 domain-containing protein [Aridibacter sp.]
MKIIAKLLFFALISATVSCTDVASNNKIANGDVQSVSNGNSALDENSNKPAATAENSETAENESSAAKFNENLPGGLIESLYKNHDNENSPFFQDKKRDLVDKFFGKSLADMIWKDAIESKGEAGALDFDPLYNAQDTEISEFKIGTAEIKDEKATVPVTFINFGEKQTIKYMLAKENGGWKIENIDYGEDNLVKIFEENSK